MLRRLPKVLRCRPRRATVGLQMSIHPMWSFARTTLLVRFRRLPYSRERVRFKQKKQPLVGFTRRIVLNSIPYCFAIQSVRRHRVRKCSCKRSKCLKLYCECFAAGQRCNGCGCTDCQNVVGNEKAIENAENAIKARNPAAFALKIESVFSEVKPQCRSYLGQITLFWEGEVLSIC